ncbi:MAG TPA: type II secretion system protein [Candidatus Deferrimicrobiaceae bacterium]|nr:type II secretion system protein [Candidatus Deferrimicrobiaceae bacterium]
MPKDSASGMTLVEVLVSLVIVFVVFLGLRASGLVVLNENIKNELRDEAVSVADQAVQDARHTVFDNLATLPADNVLRLVRNVNRPFTVTRTVANLDGDNKQVTINVAWTRIEGSQTRSYTHQAATIVRRP